MSSTSSVMNKAENFLNLFLSIWVNVFLLHFVHSQNSFRWVLIKDLKKKNMLLKKKLIWSAKEILLISAKIQRLKGQTQKWKLKLITKNTRDPSINWSKNNKIPKHPKPNTPCPNTTPPEKASEPPLEPGELAHVAAPTWLVWISIDDC